MRQGVEVSRVLLGSRGSKVVLLGNLIAELLKAKLDRSSQGPLDGDAVEASVHLGLGHEVNIHVLRVRDVGAVDREARGGEEGLILGPGDDRHVVRKRSSKLLAELVHLDTAAGAHANLDGLGIVSGLAAEETDVGEDARVDHVPAAHNVVLRGAGSLQGLDDSVRLHELGTRRMAHGERRGGFGIAVLAEVKNNVVAVTGKLGRVLATLDLNLDGGDAREHSARHHVIEHVVVIAPVLVLGARGKASLVDVGARDILNVHELTHVEEKLVREGANVAEEDDATRVGALNGTLEVLVEVGR
mmetsp:Transcript_11508/g.28665  ORF Transcript_11508/g.28665 Transcript_11508/m.28665 type:complete len:301 (+) Transcript_11508:3160-4062(+)